MHPALRKNSLFYKKKHPLFFTFFTKKTFVLFYENTVHFPHFYNPPISFPAYAPVTILLIRLLLPCVVQCQVEDKRTANKTQPDEMRILVMFMTLWHLQLKLSAKFVAIWRWHLKLAIFRWLTRGRYRTFGSFVFHDWPVTPAAAASNTTLSICSRSQLRCVDHK